MNTVNMQFLTKTAGTLVRRGLLQTGLAIGLLSAAIGTAAEPILLNEIYVNPPGNTLPHEYLEIKGPPLAPLDGYFLLAINGNPGTAGRADLALNLNGVLLGTNGLLIVKVSPTNGFIVPQETRVISDSRFIDTAVSPLNNSSVSILLVQSAIAPVEGTDYDSNDDGVFDVAPLDTATIVDAIGIRKLASDPVYGGARIPNVGSDQVVLAAERFLDDNRPRNAQAWYGGLMSGSGLTTNFSGVVTTNLPPGATLTPGSENIVITAMKIVQSGGTTDIDEDGVTDTYTIALGRPPSTGQVVIAISADSQVQISLDGLNFVSQTNVTFATNNGDAPQTITVRAVDDALVEAGHTHVGSITHRVSASDDTNNFPLTLAAVTVTANIFDNDSAFPIVLPTLETPGTYAPDDSDDPAFWIHPTDATRSLLLTTKKLGGGTVFDFNLNVMQGIVPATNGALHLNNVDVLYNFLLDGAWVDLAVFSDHVNDTIYIYRIDPIATTNPLVLISADLTTHIFPGSANDGDTAYGLCLYRSPRDGKAYAFVSRDSNLSGSIAQLEFFDAGGGQVGWRRVRTITLPDPRKVEGMVADQELGWVYLAQEKVGLWKFPAEPSRASDPGVMIQGVKTNGTTLVSDIEGLCIYYGTNGAGYLLVSCQGENFFSAFARGSTNAWLGNFVIGGNRSLSIDQVTTCDGADVCACALPGFAHGVLVVHDGENDGVVTPNSTNFKLVPWENVASVFTPALAIAPSGYDPRQLRPRFDKIARDPDGTMRWRLTGPTGRTFLLQASADLVRWDDVRDVTFDAAIIQTTYTPSSATQQFYRLMTP